MRNRISVRLESDVARQAGNAARPRRPPRRPHRPRRSRPTSPGVPSPGRTPGPAAPTLPATTRPPIQCADGRQLGGRGGVRTGRLGDLGHGGHLTRATTVDLGRPTGGRDGAASLLPVPKPPSPRAGSARVIVRTSRTARSARIQLSERWAGRGIGPGRRALRDADLVVADVPAQEPGGKDEPRRC